MPEPDFSLRGKVAVVTGASRGIGAALAAAMSAAGAHVALLSRDRTAHETVQAELAARGGLASCFEADVADPAAMDGVFSDIDQALGSVDVLVNNAGIEESCASIDVTPALWDRILDVNLRGAFFCAQAAARRMPAGSSILNVCSLTSEVGVAGSAAYGAAKSGLAGLTRALATEWAPRGLRVNGIGPGYFRTALTEGFYRDAGWREAMLPKIPLGRFGRLEDLGGAAVFLCSNAAAYVTGQILYVDGGYLSAL